MSDYFGVLYFSGADVRITIKDVELTDVSFIQLVPQQSVIPVYSVFSDSPTAMLVGKYSVRGTIAFNLQFAQPFEHLVKQFQNKDVTKIGTNLYYISELTVSLRSEASQTFIPTIKLVGVYLTGGTVSAVQDGNPLQDVYTFVALKMIRDDKVAQEV